MTYHKTVALREKLDDRGIAYSCGYVMSKECKRVSEENVTCVQHADGNPMHSITFEEDEDGALWVEDPLTVDEAMALAERVVA